MGSKLLYRNDSNSSPSSLVFLDTETSPIKQKYNDCIERHVLRLGHARYVRLEDGVPTRRKSITFTDYCDFWSWLVGVSQKSRPTWVFAHNLGFDFQVASFWQFLDSGVWYLAADDLGPDGEPVGKWKERPWRGFIVDGDPPTIVSAKHKLGYRMMALDTMNYWACSLQELGKQFKLDKLPMPDWADSDEEWEKYCTRDVEIIERAVVDMIGWIRDNDLGVFSWTAASQAMHSFRHRFMPHRIELHDFENVTKLERSGYFGGRLELLHHGSYSGEIFELDVQSAYPFVMRCWDYPCALVDHWENHRDWKPNDVDLGPYSIAEVLVSTTDTQYPFRVTEGTYYPVGKYWTTLVGPELMSAIDRGHAIDFGRWSSYRLKPLFADYVEYFWEQRQLAQKSGRHSHALFCKTMLNSLYGKFGQRTSEWTRCGENPSDVRWGRYSVFDADTGEREDYRILGCHVQRHREAGEHRMAFPAIPAFVTAHNRQYIQTLCDWAGRENVLYIVTDALYVTRRGYANLMGQGAIKPGGLGMLRCTGYGKNGEFRALNRYRIGSKKRYGMNLHTATMNPDGTFTQLEFDGLRSILHDPRQPGVRAERVKREIGHSEPRGIVGKDRRVTPLTIDASSAASLEALRTGRLGSIRELRNDQQQRVGKQPKRKTG